MFDPDAGGKIYGPRRARVLDNADPQGLSRIRVEVPGLIAESEWAEPFGTNGGGEGNRGGVRVPAKDALVYVMFLDGEPDSPVWAAAGWAQPSGTSDAPQQIAQATPAEIHKVWPLETERFLVTIDDRPASRGVIIQDKETGDGIEIDAADGKNLLQIKASAGVIIRSDGLVDIRGAVVQLQGRPVATATKPI